MRAVVLCIAVLAFAALALPSASASEAEVDETMVTTFQVRSIIDLQANNKAAAVDEDEDEDEAEEDTEEDSEDDEPRFQQVESAVEDQRQRFVEMLDSQDSLTVDTVLAELRDGLVPAPEDVEATVSRFHAVAKAAKGSAKDFLLSPQLGAFVETLARWGAGIDVTVGENFEDHGLPRRLKQIQAELSARMHLLREVAEQHPRFQQNAQDLKGFWEVAEKAAKLLGTGAQETVASAKALCVEFKDAVNGLQAAWNSASSPKGKIEAIKAYSAKKGAELYKKYKCTLCVKVLQGVVKKGCSMAIKGACAAVAPAVCNAAAPACIKWGCPALNLVLGGKCVEAVNWAKRALGIKVTELDLCKRMQVCPANCQPGQKLCQ